MPKSKTQWNWCWLIDSKIMKIPHLNIPRLMYRQSKQSGDSKTALPSPFQSPHPWSRRRRTGNQNQPSSTGVPIIQKSQHQWLPKHQGSQPLPIISMFGLIKEYHSISTLPTSYYKYNEWLDMVEIGDCCVGYKMVTTMCFPVTDGAKVDLPVFHFSPWDWVSLNWLGQFTASQPFQYIIISMMNGYARLRFEFIMYNNHHAPALSNGWR